MTSSVDKAKKLKYLGVQFITIDDPVLEQSRLALNGQRNNSSCARFSAHNSKPNIDTLQHYPGLEKSNELFTKDEISEINYCVSLGKDSKNAYRFKPTSKLSLLKQVSQSIHEKDEYNSTLTQEENNDLNLFEPSNQQNIESPQLNPPSATLTRCDSLISNQDEDENEFLPGSTRRSQLNTPSNRQGENNIQIDDAKGDQNANLSQGEIQNQIWLYAHNTSIPHNLDDFDESNKGNISARSLPSNIRRNIKSNTDNKNKINGTIKNSNSTVDKIDKKSSDGNKQKTPKINTNLKEETNSPNKTTNNDNNKNLNNEASSNNNRLLLNKNLNYQNKKKNQTCKSSLQEHYYSCLNGNHIQPINGTIVNGKTQMNLNPGEKRLKKIIAMSSPKESITPEFKTPSILNKSYCAKRIHQYLKDSAIPLPTFLQDEENSD